MQRRAERGEKDVDHTLNTDKKDTLAFSNLPITMFTRSHSERRALPGFSALLTLSTPKERDVTFSSPLYFTPRDSIFTPQSPTLSPPWVKEALSTLEKGEEELQSLRERQQTEVEEVNRELDNAVFEAQREERRLLEKVEQDYRETQRHLSQVKRENAAAVRVVQSLVDQQINKIRQLKEQILRWGFKADGSNRNQLQRGVAEVTQPWEISLTMKRVHFVSSPHYKNLHFGEVDIHEQGMTYNIGVCGDQGHKCALHSGDAKFLNINPREIRKEPQHNRGRAVENIKANSGNVRVVRKLHLSSPTENDDEQRLMRSSIQRHRVVSESSQDEEVESVCSDTQGQDLFLAIPLVSSQGESEGDESDSRHNETKRHNTVKGKRKQKALVMVSCDEPSCPLGEKEDKRNNATFSKARCKGSVSRYSLTDLSPKHLSLSQQSLSKKNSLDSGSLSSPGDSEDSCSTFIVDSPQNESLKQDHCCSTCTTELSSRESPLVNDDKNECRKMRRVSRMHLTSEPSTFKQGHENFPESNKSIISPKRQSRSQTLLTPGLTVNRVSRSLSMSAIDGDKINQNKQSLPCNNKTGNTDMCFKEFDKGTNSAVFGTAYLVKQFGKQGSGRTDFNLPSGVHATARGQLFVVDCGNARIQVTDLQKNIVQQVSPSGSERSSRICNYFDVAVNSKGLIALTCAAERALLVFSRHGRLLQTFGGTMTGSTNEDLDAPRGVTVTCQDEFIVADIKRGTLTALKLDPKTGARLERTVVTGYHRPYLVAACLTTRLIAVSERGNETGRVPCIRVLEPGWNTIRILGVCSGLGPVLTCPWGLCIDSDGDVLVADWGKEHHRVLIYPSKGVGWPLVSENLNSPRGLALLPDGHMVVSDSMNHCVKIYRYK
ncbi:PREDICTED: uncharacterized protein LOC107086808 isoform X1 [Cyprinodon variegatus]|uniref:Hemopexin-like n=1 Tax=Cyprinodon variegatus TaxID=28743 RepID=A0A3Q2GER7_CYPVA|nr:PREDICTED: uncharacterized protein LOC107086808 isoform X1 [Cyprinodon variegatus]